jgi:hypothetical protein
MHSKRWVPRSLSSWRSPACAKGDAQCRSPLRALLAGEQREYARQWRRRRGVVAACSLGGAEQRRAVRADFGRAAAGRSEDAEGLRLINRRVPIAAIIIRWTIDQLSTRWLLRMRRRA